MKCLIALITRDDVTLAIAILGAALGIGNLFIDLWRNRARLKVVPQLYFPDKTKPNRFILIDRPHDEFVKARISTGDLELCIEVINPSSKTMTVTLVGFARRFAAGRYVIMEPIIPDGGPMPRRLEPLTRLIVYTTCTPKEIWKTYGRFSFALAETESDKMFRGSSRILKHIAKSLAKSERK